MSDPDNPEIIRLEIPADFKYLATISSVLEATLEHFDKAPVDPSSHFGIKLSVHEACTNIIKHAYHEQPGRIKIEIFLYHAPKKIIIELSDHGEPAEPANFVEPDLNNPQIQGYGIFLMKQFTDQVEYSSSGGTNKWRLSKAI